MSALRETDIRPEALLEGQKAALQHDVNFLLERVDQFDSSGCPACGASGDRIWDKAGFHYDACPACATIFMNPRPNEKLLHAFYAQSANYAYWNKYIFPQSETARRQRIFKPRADRMLELLSEHGAGAHGSFLEIGAGFGTFCDEIQGRNLFDRVVALEMTPDLAETCRDRGLEVIDQAFETSGLASGSFDVVAAFEVLEHIGNPACFMKSVACLLKPGGFCVLSCPNGLGFDVQTLGPASDTVDHEHLNYFNPESLRKLLNNCGLEAVEILTPGKLDVDIVRNKVFRNEFSLSHSPFLQRIVVEGSDADRSKFQQYLALSGNSSHMWAVSQRL